MTAAAASDTSEVEERERSAGLRAPDDFTPDREKQKQLKSNTRMTCTEYVRERGGNVNILEGLELHQNLLSSEEQARLIEIIDDWLEYGRNGELRPCTHSKPKSWVPGKGRETVQFGCCYNYAIDSYDRPPGILYEEVVEPMPDFLLAIVDRLIRWKVLKAKDRPDTAIINSYEIDEKTGGHCIPPHIDSQEFVRPFCTISLLSEQEIWFGARLRARGKDFPGQFIGNTFEMVLPLGSCLVLQGNGADVAKHCIPCVTQPRISITLRKMHPDHAKYVKRNAEMALGMRPFIESDWKTREQVNKERERSLQRDDRSINGHGR